MTYSGSVQFLPVVTLWALLWPAQGASAHNRNCFLKEDSKQNKTNFSYGPINTKSKEQPRSKRNAEDITRNSGLIHMMRECNGLVCVL